MTSFSAPYSYSGSRVSLRQQLAKNTFKHLHPEVQRRFVYLQLVVNAEEGVEVGVGTGQRVQPAAQANHASPGNSNHEDFPSHIDPPATPENGAVAIDVVGYPTHEVGWTAMEKHLARCGFTSFTIPSIRANWSTYEKRGYQGSWDRPHIQPIEIPYSRNFRTKPWNLQRWDIPSEYDIESPIFNVDDPFSPFTPIEQPLTEDDDTMTPAQEKKLDDLAAAVQTIWNVFNQKFDSLGADVRNTYDEFQPKIDELLNKP